MRARQWFAVALLLIGVLGPWLRAPSSAHAHGGLVVLNEVIGPYRVVSRVSWAGNLVDQEVMILDASRKQPITVATVALELYDRAEATRGPFVGRMINGVIDVRYPPPESGDGWRVRLTVTGPLGPAAIEHRYRTPDKEWAVGSGWSGFAVTVLMGLGLVAMPVIAWRFWLRPAPAQPSPDPQGSET